MTDEQVAVDAASSETQPAIVRGAELTRLEEIRPGDPSAWDPRSYSEWESREKLRAFLSAWSEQVKEERALRRRFANWIFTLITVETLALLALTVGLGRGWLRIDADLLKILLPSVLTQVFGLGFLVAKYLFNQPLRQSMDVLARGATTDVSPGSSGRSASEGG